MKRAMTSKRHRPEEVVAKLREADEALSRGNSLEDVAQSLGVSLMTLHRWRTEYGSTDRVAVKRLKELERENGRLKRLVADQALDIQILKEVASNFKSSGEF
jgi:transposase-like protein